MLIYEFSGTSKRESMWWKKQSHKQNDRGNVDGEIYETNDKRKYEGQRKATRCAKPTNPQLLSIIVYKWWPKLICYIIINCFNIKHLYYIKKKHSFFTTYV